MPHPLMGKYHNHLARALQHQYNEKTLKDPAIREQFNTYCFVHHKEKVVDLLRRVCTVSVETQAVVNAMSKAER